MVRDGTIVDLIRLSPSVLGPLRELVAEISGFGG